MFFLIYYFLSAAVLAAGMLAVHRKNGTSMDRKMKGHLILLCLIPFLNSLFAVLIWVEYRYGEEDEN